MLLLCLLFLQFAPASFQEIEPVKKHGEIRVKALRGWDRLLTWALSAKNPVYTLKIPLKQHKFTIVQEQLALFEKNYGFFSIYNPIVGMVTESKKDVEVAQELLDLLGSTIKNEQQLRFATDEILAKLVAYRTLEKGMVLYLPTIEGRVKYLVDEVLNLWLGMPAFGLIPEGDGTPILLFRGTDLSFTTQKGWASMLSDLDITGPGHATFLRCQQKIHNWLSKREKPARLVGFSLGGAFVLYTLIYENEWVSKEISSTAFNSPGLSRDLMKRAKEMGLSSQVSYINRGDFVSQLGYLLSNVWEVSLERMLQVIESHVTLMCIQPQFHLSEVDITKENVNRKLISERLQESDLGDYNY